MNAPDQSELFKISGKIEARFGAYARTDQEQQTARPFYLPTLFICPLFGRIVVLWYPAGGDVAFILGVGYVAVSKMSVYKYPKDLGCDKRYLREHDTFREAVNGFEGGHDTDGER